MAHPHVLHTIWLDEKEPTNIDTLWVKPLKRGHYAIFVYGSDGWKMTTALFRGTTGNFIIDDLPPIDTVDSNDALAIDEDGINKKISVEEFVNFIYGALDLDGIISNLEEEINSTTARYGTTAYWDSSDYMPSRGQIIIYSDYNVIEAYGELVSIPGIKVGTGNAYVQELPFLGEDVSQLLLEHVNNNSIHVTNSNKTFWNNKLNVDDNAEVVDGVLIFNRN